MKTGLRCGLRLAAAFVVLFASSPARGGANLNELIQKLPAQDAASRDEIFRELVALGPNGVLGLIGMLQEPGKGDDVKARYALHGLALYVARPGAASEKKMFGQALASALSADLPTGVKTFLLQQARIAGGPELVKVLGAHLLDEATCLDAVDALLTIREGVEPLLRAALGKVQGNSLKAIVQALGTLRDAESVGVLMKLASVQDRDLRLTALYALGNIGDPAAVPVLIKAASVESPYERACATDALILLARRLAEDGRKEESLKLYRELWKSRSDAEEPHVRAAALLGASEAEAMKVKPKPVRPTVRTAAEAPSAAPAPAKKQLPQVATDVLAAWDERLRTRAAEALRGGARPNIYLDAIKKRGVVSGIDAKGALKVSAGGAEMDISWDRLTIPEKKALALAVLDDDPRSHALAAFYLLASGDEQAAAKHLRMAGDHADAVRGAFEKGN